MNQENIPVQSGNAHIIVKKNRRTLRRRIQRMMYLSSFINIIIFSIITLCFIAFIIKPITNIASNFITSTIALEMNDAEFLHKLKIERLEDYKDDSAEALAWKTKIEEMT